MPAGRPARPAAAAIQSSKEPSRELRFDLLKLLADLSSEFLGARIQGPFGGLEAGGSGGVAGGGSLLWQGCSASGFLRGELVSKLLQRLHQKLIRIEKVYKLSFLNPAYLSDCKRVKVVFLQHYFNDRKGQGGCAVHIR